MRDTPRTLCKDPALYARPGMEATVRALWSELQNELATTRRQLLSAQESIAKLEAEKAALLPQPPREGIYAWAVPLEHVRSHADYWINGGRKEKTIGRAVLCVEQAVNSWKNACYSYAEKLAGKEQQLLSAQADIKRLREALGKAKYAIKGREHTGFIDEALATPLDLSALARHEAGVLEEAATTDLFKLKLGPSERYTVRDWLRRLAADRLKG